MKNTKERILTEGLNLLTQTGLAGVTVGQLAAKTGLSKSGLFAHFGSKEEIQLGLLEETLRVGASSFVAPAMQKPPGLPRLQAIFEGWLGWTSKAGLPGGCPIAAGLFELDDASPTDPVRLHLQAMEERWRAFLQQLTMEAVAAGELHPALDAAQFVWELCAVYLNHHVSSRFLHDPRATERALTAFAALLDRSRPPRENTP